MGQTGTVLYRQPDIRVGGRTALKLDGDSGLEGHTITTYNTFGGQSETEAIDALHPVAGEFDNTGAGIMPVRRQRMPRYSPSQLVASAPSLLRYAEQVSSDERRRTAAIRIQKIIRGRLARAKAHRIRRERELNPVPGLLGNVVDYNLKDVNGDTKGFKTS